MTLESPATEILYGGAAGGGKSFLMRVIAVMYCMTVPGIQVYILRRLSTDLKDNHLYGEAGLLAILAGIPGVSVNEMMGQVKFDNGAMIHLKHCQHEKNKYDFQGKEIHVLLVDELTHFTESIYRYLRGRVRRGEKLVTDLLLPRIICGTNPGGVGHNWVRRTFVRARKEMTIERVSKDEGGMLRQFIPAKLSDNPSLNAEEYAGNLAGLGDSALVRAMLDGDWDIVAGGMFDDLMGGNKDLLMIPAFSIPNNWEVTRSFDWGSSSPFSVCWWAQSNGEEVEMKDGTRRSFYPGTLFLIHEWYGADAQDRGLKMLNKDIAKGINERERFFPFNVSPGPADNSIFDVVNGQSIAMDMETENITWTRSDKSKGSRVNGWQIMRSMYGAALTHPMENPGLFAFDHCHNYWDTVSILPRDETRPEDADTEANDHIADAVRYRCSMPIHRGTSGKIAAR